MADTKRGKRVKLPECGGKTRNKDTKNPLCKKPAGWGTDHPGTGKCKLHGGASLVRSGRFSKVMRTRISDLIAHFENDPDPLNIFAELAAARALFVDFINRYDENTEAMLAWHESYQLTRRPLPEDLLMALESVVTEWEIAIGERGEEATEKQKGDASMARKFIGFLRGEDKAGKPRIVLDISDAIGHVDTITKIVERIEKIRAENAISRKDLLRVMDAMGKGVLKHVTDEATLKAIRGEWLSIAL